MVKCGRGRIDNLWNLPSFHDRVPCALQAHSVRLLNLGLDGSYASKKLEVLVDNTQNRTASCPFVSV